MDELLESGDDIETSAFLSSSKQLFRVIDNMMSKIDDRITFKKNINNNYYTGAGGYNQEDFGPGGAGGS